MTALLETRALSTRIGVTCVCRDLNLRVQGGTRWGVLGTNGVGKTTLLHTLAGLRQPATGEIFLTGKSMAALSRRDRAQACGLLFQDSGDAFPTTVWESALLGRHPHLQAWAWESAEDEKIALRALRAVGLSHMRNRLTSTLSGGERRRLALAALLAQDPALFLLDEPANHLDMHHQVAVLELLSAQVREQGKALVMVLHDVNFAARFCDAVLLLFGDGETLQGPVREVMTSENLHRLYRHKITSVETADGRFFFPA